MHGNMMKNLQICRLALYDDTRIWVFYKFFTLYVKRIQIDQPAWILFYPIK